jgi:hypothetical protein
MTSYPEPRKVELRLLDTDRLTLLEYGRALAAAGVKDQEVAPLLRAAFRTTRDADPEDFARGLALAYAIVWQLEKRSSPALTWAEAQTWDVVPIEATAADYEAVGIERAADELVAKVALGASMSPLEAGRLTLSQVSGVGKAASSSTRRRARVHR